MDTPTVFNSSRFSFWRIKDSALRLGLSSNKIWPLSKSIIYDSSTYVFTILVQFDGAKSQAAYSKILYQHDRSAPVACKICICRYIHVHTCIFPIIWIILKSRILRFGFTQDSGYDLIWKPLYIIKHNFFTPDKS